MRPRLFADLLTKAVRTVAAREHKTIAIVQDELGYALDRAGGSSIEYWRKGHIPAESEDVEKLMRELVRREGLDRKDCERFLHSADYGNVKSVLDTLFVTAVHSPVTPARDPRELSPFVAGPPITVPRQFFGRERELRRIFGLWRRFPMQHIALVGPKRSGKTSLLHYVQTITRTNPTDLRAGQRYDWLPHSERYRWVLVDFQDARMGKRARLLRHILTCLDMPVPDSCTLDAFMDVVSQHLQTPAIILMDEIGAGLASPELDEPFWWSLRSLVSSYTDGNLAFVLTAHESPEQLAEAQGKPSPFFNIFQVMDIGPFSDEAARALISSSPAPFPDANVPWLLEQSGCWPCLLQILCQVRLAALEEGDGEGWQQTALRQIAPFRYLLE